MIRMLFYNTEKYSLAHLHAEYQGQVVVYSITEGRVLTGSTMFDAATQKCMQASIPTTKTIRPLTPLHLLPNPLRLDNNHILLTILPIAYLYG